MKLAFYYHICIHQENGKLSLPSYLGVFVDSLAKQVNQLYVVMHQANETEKLECDFELQQKNIQWISLGLKTPAWHRAIFYRKILKTTLLKIEDCNLFIVRSPTPLAPYFYKYLHNTKLWFMIVGDYVDGAEHLKNSTLRNRLIYAFLLWNDKLFTKEIKRTNVLVNSPSLFKKYESIAQKICLIKTTTLSDNDFFERKDTCESDLKKILFTGRIDPAKGLFELLEAIFILQHEHYNIELHIVGWESIASKPVETEMKQKAAQLGITERVFFHGRKKVGAELNYYYQQADFYVIPSYHEGFPRTIWEAMANSLPVIATSVGAIPEYLTDRSNVILIEPKSIHDIVKAIKELFSNPKLRQDLILNGREIAKENTLDFQSKKIIEILNESNE